MFAKIARETSDCGSCWIPIAGLPLDHGLNGSHSGPSPVLGSDCARWKSVPTTEHEHLMPHQAFTLLLRPIASQTGSAGPVVPGIPSLGLCILDVLISPHDDSVNCGEYRALSKIGCARCAGVEFLGEQSPEPERLFGVMHLKSCATPERLEEQRERVATREGDD